MSSSRTTRDNRLGVDIGGTFTDVALECGGRQFTTKVLTTSQAPEKGVIEAVDRVLEESGLKPGDLGIVIHGTTLATNALIERKGARAAMLTTDGFRDTVEIATESRFDVYDINLNRPDPLVPRDRRLEVLERMSASGQVLRPLDEEHLRRLIDDTLAPANVESLAIGLIHAYANPRHEERCAEIVAERLPGIGLSLSSQVSPEMREYERFSTTCANAYVQPLMVRYVTALQTRLTDRGVTCPLFLMLSGGGLATVDTAVRFPVRLVESGPAGGALFSAHIARQAGAEAVLSFDMGGTTAKICLIDDRAAQTARSFEVARVHRFRKGSGLPLRIPVIEMVEIGAGGGSIARVDDMGRVTVGPDSAGSEPGPACYGRGGDKATVTDADLILGRIDPGRFHGSRLALDAKAAGNSLDRDVGAPMGLDTLQAAFGVSEVVDSNMANAARVHAVESGKNAGERTLIAFGGAAPVHALRLAERLDIRRIIVPAGAGVGSSVGFLRAPVAFELVRSGYQTLEAFDAAVANRLLDEIGAEAEAAVHQGAGDAPMEVRRLAYMRYSGQGSEVAVPIPEGTLGADGGAVLQAAFDDVYRAQYSHLVPGAEVETISWSVLASAATEAPPISLDAPETHRAESDRRGTLYDPASGEEIEVPLYWRDDLAPGARVAGPAVIAESQTSTVLYAGYEATVGAAGHIEILRTASGAEAQTTEGALAELHKQVMWNRLIAVVEEQAQALIRTAFSTSVRESGDLSAGVFDRRGRMVAQAVTGTPGHVNSMANAIVHFLAKFPIDGMKPGDHYITNDPWMTSGHLHDITIVSPTFHDGKAVALFACTIHVVDIGGRGFGPDGRQVYEEGLFLPLLSLCRAGTMNEDLLEIIRHNVREQDQVIGDIFSCASSNDEGSKYLGAMMAEYALADIESLSDYIIDRSRSTMLARMGEWPRGTYKSSVTVDGHEKPITLAGIVTIDDRGIHVDHTGTSGPSQYGINVVLNYTHAYSTFAVNCIVGGDIPNNYGSLGAVTVTAPEGCILNVQHPAPVAMRHGLGHTLPDVIFGCLDQAMPGRVPAQGSAALWNPQFRGGPFAVDVETADAPTENLSPFDVLSFHAGGMGARPGFDGLSATAFPSGVRTIAVEVTESISPLVFWRKELRRDTGGAGRTRGGLGHRMELGHAAGEPFAILLTSDRIVYPPKGLNGGLDGGPACVTLKSGKPLRPKGQQTVPADDRIVLEIAGGAGYGEPFERNAEKVAEDVRWDLVSREAAERDYGVVLTADGHVDAAATARRRQERAAA